VKYEIRILIVWIVVCIAFRLLLLLPHRYFDDAALLNVWAQLLLFLLSVYIAKNSKGSQRFVFINLAVFFGFVIPLCASSFIGTTLFPNSQYAGSLYHIYVNKIAKNLVLLFTVFYLVFDYAFTPRTVAVKYLVSFALAAGVVVVFYSHILFHPFGLYEEPEYVALRKMETSSQAFVARSGRQPTDNELASAVGTSINATGLPQVLGMVQSLLPYLKEGGETSLFWKPLDLKSIYVNCIVLSLVGWYLFLLYKGKYPYSSYMDKIVAMFIIFSALEIIHNFGYIYSESLGQYRGLFKVGQFFSVVCYIIMVYAFDLKLRFSLSVTGRYYETALQKSPQSVTSWKDEIDRFLSRSFFEQDRFKVSLGHFSKQEKNNQTK